MQEPYGADDSISGGYETHKLGPVSDVEHEHEFVFSFHFRTAIAAIVRAINVLRLSLSVRGPIYRALYTCWYIFVTPVWWIFHPYVTP